VERALAPNPNDANTTAKAGTFFTYAGQPERGETLIRRAMRLNPYYQNWYWTELATSLFVAGRYLESLEAFQRSGEEYTVFALVYLATCAAPAGQREAARGHVDSLKSVRPDFRIADYIATQPFRCESDRARLTEGFVMAERAG